MAEAAKTRRGWWAGAAVVLAVLALIVWRWRGGSEEASSEPSKTAVSRVLASAPAAGKAHPSAAGSPIVPQQTAATPPPPTPPDPSPGTTPAVPPEPPPIELPPTTQVLTEEFFPGTTEWDGVPVDESHQYQLRILPVRYNVVEPMPIAVQLEMIDRQGQRQPLPSPRVRVRSLENAALPWIDLPVKDDGSGSDAQAGDLLYTATLQPNEEQKQQLYGHVLVEGAVDVPGTGLRAIPSGLIYTQGPRAKLTGRWRDSVRQGHLELEAELEVDKPGLFTLMAQVFGPNLEPIAWVKQLEQLPAGRGHITLEVFGKVLHDSGIDGPYRVRQVLLTRDYENSGRYDPGVTVEEAHKTRAYKASEFSADAYVPPKRDVAEVTAEDPSQRDKPPPERTRVMAPAIDTTPPPASNAPPQTPQNLGR